MKVKRIDYRHIIYILVLCGAFVFGVFFFPNAFGRLIESCKDFGLSIAYWFCNLFGIENNISPTVLEQARLPYFELPQAMNEHFYVFSFPKTWETFKIKFVLFWQAFGNLDNFKGYFHKVGDVTVKVLESLVFVIPIVVVIILFYSQYLKKENNDYNRDSKPLKAYKAVSNRVLEPIKQFFVSLREFGAEHRIYLTILVLFAMFAFNIFAIILEFFAYYFYILSTYDFSTVYIQVYKLILDLSPALHVIPIWVWILLLLAYLNNKRKGMAHRRLVHFENRNCGVINERPIVYMVCGTMGKRKTTIITDMALSQEKMLRDKAFELLLENDLKFPNFPWINLENELKLAIKHHQVYNLATCAKFIKKKEKRWNKHPCRSKMFDYDFEKYGVEYYDELRTIGIWDVLRAYSQLYFIYIVQSSLIISNYSVRVDSVLGDLGNFPLWNSDFFHRDKRMMDAYSRHAHILDFDALRLGKKLVEDSDTKDSFEFGVVLITEIGKERGNAKENLEIKKTDFYANPKNDGFNIWLKMIRHSATVDNFPFVRVILDEQRPASLGADARELCDIVYIDECSDVKLTLPFFGIFEMIYAFFRGRFERYYYEYRYKRADNTLTLHAFKWLTTKIVKHYNGVYNQYGYRVVKLLVENGTQDGEKKERKYYLMSKKIYSERFSTDCFSDFFKEKAMRSSVGIEDMQEYKTVKADFAELEKQNSYFINDLRNGL